MESDAALNLLDLPAELVYQILSYLQPVDLAQVARTCRRLNTQSSDDQIWLPLVNENIPEPISAPTPLHTFRDLYIAHHPHWFLPKHRVFFSDSEPNGKLVIAKYDPRRGCIEAYTMVAMHGRRTIEVWEKDRSVIIHSFDPSIRLDMNQPVLKLDVDNSRTDRQTNAGSFARDRSSSSRYGKEILMDTFAEAGLYGSFMLCRKLPQSAIGHSTRVWPPRLIPSEFRVMNSSRDGYKSAGHRPAQLVDVSQHSFRLRKWVEYTGRRSSPSIMSFSSPNGLSAALGMAAPYFASSMSSFANGGLSVRMPEDIATYATLPERCYTPTKEKPWRGIWCGDYSGHGCEFLLISQPDKEEEQPLPAKLGGLRNWFRTGRQGSVSSDGSYESALEDVDIDFEDALAAQRDVNAAFETQYDDEPEDAPYASTAQAVTDYKDAPTGRLEAIKLTGDPNIPRGEYTFIAPEIGHGGFVRVADEEIFKGARVVRSAGHIAGRGFEDGKLLATRLFPLIGHFADLLQDQYTPSQLIMISEDRLAQFWEGLGGHISYYVRVDMKVLLKS
jgi:hypothetical protein